MCLDPGSMLGLAMGISSVAGQAAAAQTNAEIATQQARLEHASQAREYLIESDASSKEQYKAAQERNRAVAEARVAGADMQGTTFGEQVSEQRRQGALSIANAKDREEVARGNYVMAAEDSSIKAANDIRANAVNPLAAFTEIATSGIKGYGSFK